MCTLLDRLRALSAAEEFFDALGLPFDQTVLNVNRLHILKRFRDLATTEGVAAAPEAEQEALARACLERAYTEFSVPDSHARKDFKVFRDQRGGFVSLDSLGRR